VTKPRPRIPRQAPSFGLRRWLLSGNRSLWYYLKFHGDEALERALWLEHSAAVVAHHVKRSPGTRPRLWWLWEAPEPRRRLGGKGEPYSQVLHYGVPQYWHLDATLWGPDATPSDSEPPLFESEASFLRRLNLLLPDERRLSERHYRPQALRRAGSDRIGLYPT
jgi:hypothetical protein